MVHTHTHGGVYTQVGVDKRLRVVVDGEALLNDGSAYVLFLLFQVGADIC